MKGYTSADRTESMEAENGKSATIDFDDLADDVDIPDFIKKHNAVLRFPDKVSEHESINLKGICRLPFRSC